MAITATQGTQAFNSTSTTPLVVNVPATTAGDITYIVFGVNAASATVTTPTGWTLIQGAQPTSTTTGYGCFLRRVWQPGDATTVSITTPAGARPMCASPILISGADTTTPEATSAITPGGSVAAGGNVACPSLSATALTQMLLCGYFMRQTPTTGATASWTPPTGMTEVGDTWATTSAFNNPSVGAAVLTPSATGAQGVKNAVPLVAGQVVGMSILLNAAAAPVEIIPDINMAWR